MTCRLAHTVLCLVVVIVSVVSADVVLVADNADGRDACWQARYELNKHTWGIEGNHVVTEGSMWFDAFPGADGEYDISMGIVAESDGRPAYRLTAGSRTIDEGVYPWGAGERCSSDKNIDRIDMGRHTMNHGERIELWGESTYECSIDHGAYCRWYEIRFVPVGGSTATPTAIVSPAEGAELTEGVSYTFSGEGENLAWSYDASSDGLGEIQMGTGATVDYAVPTGVTGNMLMHVTLTGSNGTVTRTYQIAAASTAPMVTVTAPNGGETITVGSPLHVQWEADPSQVTDVTISLTVDEGESWVVLNPEHSISRTDPEWGDYVWTVPETILAGNSDLSTVSSTCRVRVAKYEATDGQFIDMSDGTFTIESSGAVSLAPQLTVRQAQMSATAPVFMLNGSRLSCTIMQVGAVPMATVTHRGTTVRMSRPGITIR